MRKKLIIFAIALLVTITSTILLAVYDYNVYYSPNGNNAAELQSRYNEYIANQSVDIIGNNDFLKQTEDKIQLFRIYRNYYYSNNPIYEKAITYNGLDLFRIKIYEGVAQYTPDVNTRENRIKYETYIYDVKYDNLRTLFKDPKVLPNNDSLIDSSEYPSIVINFYPNDEYKTENALFSTSAGAGYQYELYNGTIIYGTKLSSALGYTLNDFAAEPNLDPDDKTPIMVQYLSIQDYTSAINLSDENNEDENDDRSRFNNGAYVKIDVVLEAGSDKYVLKDSVLKELVSEMTFTAPKDIDLEGFVKGYSGDVLSLNEDIINKLKDLNVESAKSIKTYKVWITEKYVWWQCLIAFVVVGLIMTGFYFTFTYEEKPKNKKVLSKKQ